MSGKYECRIEEPPPFRYLRCFPRRRFRAGESSKKSAVAFTGSACIKAPSMAPSIARACLEQNRDPCSAIRAHGTQALRLPAIA